MPPRILLSPSDLNASDLLSLYAGFNLPVTRQDCGQMCIRHNPAGKPFCCDICHAVPAAYTAEWELLQPRTNLWHPWQADECTREVDPVGNEKRLRASTPTYMYLLACSGHQNCQREYRLISCRAFPFFPYITQDHRFLGLAYDWEFENTCWVISNLHLVTPEFRGQFLLTWDALLSLFQDEWDAYALRSEEMRRHFGAAKRRIPILHRNGAFHLLSPASGRIRRVDPSSLSRFGPYR